MSCIKSPICSAFKFVLGVAGALAAFGSASALELEVSAGFPGGNIRVIRNAGGTVELAPDNRDSNPWFFWQFEARADAPGTARFVFADPPKLGLQGPAVSLDRGLSWQWLGTGTVQFSEAADSFGYAFTNAGQTVRFCAAIPYGPAELDGFLAGRTNDPRLAVGVLTTSLKGRPVRLLRVGEPGPGRLAVLMTARHHACESMASYVLEGFLAEALADSPAGAAFRSRYVLYAVPMVDADGVAEGDQGKGRQPHDHNRDYGPTNRYPEVRAIQKLARDRNVELVVDFHCPVIRGESHTFFYFDGLAVPPTVSNVLEWTDWIGEEGPQAFPRGPFPWMKAPVAGRFPGNLPCSVYFARQPAIRMAVTLETPYAMAYEGFDEKMARDYGAALLRAWTRMEFAAAGEARPQGLAALRDFEKRLGGLVRSRPEEADRLAAGVLADPATSPVFRNAACFQLGLLRVRQGRLAGARAAMEAVAADPAATERQRSGALAQGAVIACRDPASTTGTVEAALAAFFRHPHPSAVQRAQVHGEAADFFIRTNRLERALLHAREQHVAAVWNDKGATLNRIAAVLDKLGRPADALACRLQAVELLRKQLTPVPVGVFGPLMAADLYEALCGIPGATDAERKAAADMVLNHPLKLEDPIRRVKERDTRQP